MNAKLEAQIMHITSVNSLATLTFLEDQLILHDNKVTFDKAPIKYLHGDK